MSFSIDFYAYIIHSILPSFPLKSKFFYFIFLKYFSLFRIFTNRKTGFVFSLPIDIYNRFPLCYTVNEILLEFGGQVMTTQHTDRIRRIFGIVLSAVLVIAGICLMAACYRIYTTGDGTFSREIVAAHFGKIALPVYFCLVLVIGSFLLELFLPGTVRKPLPEKNEQLILQRLQSKVDPETCEENLRIGILRERKARKCHRTVTIVLLCAGSGIFLCYGLNGSNFHQREITDSLIQAMYLLIPCMAVPFGYGVFAAYHSRASIRREIALLKQAEATRSPAPAVPASSGKSALVLRWVILAVAVVLLIWGYAIGGTADVLTKAINICTECVGLG